MGGPAVFGGRWQVVRRLARGGMGVVYVARDLDRGEQVALKVLYDKEHDVTRVWCAPCTRASSPTARPTS